MNSERIKATASYQGFKLLKTIFVGLEIAAKALFKQARAVAREIVKT